ncbi:MAG: 3-deoxy-7-phosphoheptulonate synthase [Chlamydiae bacterium]|nr:3-deoxy-7-phosphoheptulonate synthase [Chlamydiota bacterium]MBI3265975.1 3-deoxy-7-phosphoheptulonate synthase [Chlamydiota bacterium]
MIIVLKINISQEQKEHVIQLLEEHGLKAVVSHGVERTIVGVIGSEENVLKAKPHVEALEGVESVVRILKPFKLVSREFKKEDTVVDVRGVKIGARRVVAIAGPCSVENKKMMFEIADEVKKGGATILRGGAYKPRTSPYAFQGLGRHGLEILAEARERTGMPVCTEIMDTRDIEAFEEFADILQVGARNVQNFNLLKEVGKSKKPVLLKRGMMTTITEYLMAAEYILSNGNPNVILCERGIRTFEDMTRNTLDLSAIPLIKSLSHLPIISDPSHGTGKRDLIPPMAKASVACGADGLILEVHNCPEKALSDGAQSLYPSMFVKLMEELKPVAHAVGREI